MRLQVKARNFELSPEIRDYAETKLRGSRSSSPRRPGRGRARRGDEARRSSTAEATIFAKGSTLRATESTSDMRASIDQLVDDLERQVVSLPREAPPRTPPARPSTTAFEPRSGDSEPLHVPARARGRPRRSSASATEHAAAAVGRRGHPRHPPRARLGRRRRPSRRRSSAGDRAIVRRAARRRAASLLDGRHRRRAARGCDRPRASGPVPRRGGAAQGRRSGRSAAGRSRSSTLPGTAGEEIELSSHDGERTLVVDGEHVFGSIPALERPDHVVRARRIVDDVWEVEVRPALSRRAAGSQAGASGYPVVDVRHDGFEKFLRFGEGGG